MHPSLVTVAGNLDSRVGQSLAKEAASMMHSYDVAQQTLPSVVQSLWMPRSAPVGYREPNELDLKFLGSLAYRGLT